MILFELIVGFAVIGLLVLIAVFFAKSRRRSTASASEPSDAPSIRSPIGEDGNARPRNKANMDQPQEEFIEPEAAREKH